MTSTINSVTGPVDADDLGFILPHEHLILDQFPVSRLRDRVLDDAELACEELERYVQAGGRTLVDVTPPDLGRDPAVLAQISQRTGVNVIMGCGRYREPFYERDIWRRSTRDISDELIAEIINGVDGIRPGVIGEIGVDQYFMSPVEERVHRAAARAHLATGLSIMTHAMLSPVGLHQLEIFREEGVDLRRVAIGHCDSYPHRDYHEAILRQGAFVEFDFVRGTNEYETRKQVRQIVELISAGFVSQLLVSHDVCSLSHLVAYGGKGYAYIPLEFTAELERAGVPRSDVEQLVCENPRRFLVGDT